MYIKKYWGNFIGGSDDSLNLVAFLEDQKKEEIPLSEIFTKIGLDKQNWGFRQTVEYLEFTHSSGVEMDFHFAIDTGMSRIGFQVDEESADICKEICKLPNINAEGLFSHFATADETDLSKTYEQQNKFKTFIEMLRQRGIEIPIKHLNNSAGIMHFDDCFDMVRAGIILYGLYPSHEIDENLLDVKPVMEWKTYVSHIKTLEAGREISYGGTFKVEKPIVVATIPVGYADGYPRCLSNIGKVLINGKYANILGRVCMDQFMIDITDIPNVKLETPVTLIGRDGDEYLSMEEVSEQAYSFNYELPCRISRRVTRMYVKDGKEVKSVNYLR